ncbi:hypothetical protein COOONC_10982, partial [Cooperia oncophora]
MFDTGADRSFISSDLTHRFRLDDIDTSPVLAGSQRHYLATLSEEGKEFLLENDMQLSIDPSIKTVRPAVLLGCADLFSLLDTGLRTNCTLPSGLTLIPSKLSPVLAGSQRHYLATLSEEGKEFLLENDMQLSIDPSIKTVRPTVLLGCADLFSLLDTGLRTHCTLPSGL